MSSKHQTPRVSPPRWRARLLQVFSTGLVTVSLLGAQSAPDSAPTRATPDWRNVRTEDGSEFLLLPNVPGTVAGIVHWVVVNPSGPLEDPPGRPGLARAVLRASVGGTSKVGSTDWTQERGAMELVTSIRQQIESLQARGEEPPADLLQRLAEARSNAQSLGDQSVWLGGLRRAPAVDVFLDETPSSTLLHLATRDTALARVAALLIERRENSALRDLGRHHADVTEEMRREQRTAVYRLGGEIEVLAYPGRSRTPIPEGPPRAVPFAEAFALHAELLAPTATRHVLAGSFDPDAVEATLRTAFVSTALAERKGRSAITPPQSGRRSATIPSPGAAPAAALAIALPGSFDPETTRALTHYLSVGSDAPLRSGLEALGYPQVDLQIRSPFPPDHGEGLYAIFVESLESNPGAAPDKERQPLDKALLRSLQQMFSKPLRSDRFATSRLRIRADRAERRRDAKSTSLWLARDWGSLRRPAAVLLNDEDAPSPRQLWEDLRNSFQTGLRVAVGTEDAR